MSYLVLARKWRPQTFSDLVGQEHVRRTLENAIAQNRVAHAFLFTGVRGVGKTTSARILAKALNCVKGPTAAPCLECPQCLDIAAGTDLDVRELDGSIVFQAMPGPPRDSLDPEFLAATTALRRWLWPHTFKNPLDAAGFEAEVGVPPAPPPSVG